MKKMLLSMLTFLICMFGVLGFVKADTSKCTPELKAEFQKNAANVNAAYEFVYDENNNVKGFDIKVYNVGDNMSVIYNLSPAKTEKKGVFKKRDGTAILYDDNLKDIYTYNIEIYSVVEGCNYKIKTISLIKPKRNTYSELVYCSYEENEKSPYCQEWITKNINMSREDVEKILKNNIKKTTTTEPTSVCVDCGAEGVVYSIKGIYKKYKYTIIIAVILVLVLNIFAIVLLLKNGEGGVI